MFANKIIFLLPLSVAMSSFASAQLKKDHLNFIQDVLFHTEYQTTPNRHCKRWESRPRLSVFGNQDRHPKVVENVVDQLNSCLPENQQIMVLPPESEGATLKLYFVKHNEIRALADQNGFEFDTVNWGCFYCWWNRDYVIERSIVMIAEDKLSGYRLHHFVLEEVTQSLGFPGDSHRLADSVFYEDRDKREFGKTTKLSKQDRELIRFHYQHNRPGDIPIQVGLNMAKNWRKSIRNAGDDY